MESSDLLDVFILKENENQDFLAPSIVVGHSHNSHENGHFSSYVDQNYHFEEIIRHPLTDGIGQCFKILLPFSLSILC